MAIVQFNNRSLFPEETKVEIKEFNKYSLPNLSLIYEGCTNPKVPFVTFSNRIRAGWGLSEAYDTPTNNPDLNSVAWKVFNFWKLYRHKLNVSQYLAYNRVINSKCTICQAFEIDPSELEPVKGEVTITFEREPSIFTKLFKKITNFFK